MPIHVVGLGQDPGNLPDYSESVVEHAECLFGGHEQLAHFEDHPAEKIPITVPLDGVIERIAEAYADKKMVVVLADGDPLFYGIGAILIDRLGPEDIHIYPNVTTLQQAAARVKIPWQDVAAVSLHGRSDYAPLYSALISNQWVAVFTDAKSIPSAIAQDLFDKGGETHCMWVLENLETENERVGRFALDEARRKSFSKKNLVLLERRRDPEIPLALGTPDDLFMREKDLITKGPVRAVSVAALRLRKDSVLWDLGAGCGSVGIEASSICHQGRVFSVEKNADRVAMIRENIRRAGAYPVETVHGHMPTCLAELPDPDRVFIGGGLPEEKVLDTACERLAPGGRLVCNAILLDTLTKARTTFEALDWEFSITLVQAAETKPLAGRLRLAGDNPVFVIIADKPAK
ncbi:precorrin-6y C5,15-methyltransferase (decarboxylating) subunit CbiE [Desulfocurvus sp. DL9XJH121]